MSAMEDVLGEEEEELPSGPSPLPQEVGVLYWWSTPSLGRRQNAIPFNEDTARVRGFLIVYS
jgi:hypothetical protein